MKIKDKLFILWLTVLAFLFLEPVPIDFTKGLQSRLLSGLEPGFVRPVACVVGNLAASLNVRNFTQAPNNAIISSNE